MLSPSQFGSYFEKCYINRWDLFKTFLFSLPGGVCLLRVPRGASSLAPPEPGAGTAAMQRGAALGGHGDPAVPVAAQESAAAAQVHQDCIAVGPGLWLVEQMPWLWLLSSQPQPNHQHSITCDLVEHILGYPFD